MTKREKRYRSSLREQKRRETERKDGKREKRREKERERKRSALESGRKRNDESSAYDLSSTTATTYMSHRTRSLGHRLGVVQTYQRHPQAVCLRPPFNKIPRARSGNIHTPKCHSFDHRDVPVSRPLFLLLLLGYPSLSQANILPPACILQVGVGATETSGNTTRKHGPHKCVACLR